MDNKNNMPQEPTPVPPSQPNEFWNPHDTANTNPVPLSPTPPVSGVENPQPTRPMVVSDSGGLPPTRPGRSHKKRNIILTIVTLLLVIVGAAAAYVFLIYLPNRPEIVLQKAVESYINDNGDYDITGNLDQAGPNDPDYKYDMSTNAAGQATAKLSMSTFLLGPSVDTVLSNDKLFISLNGFEDTKKLATHYRNVGQPGIQEAIAFFAESSGISSKLGKWIEVDKYITDQPQAPKNTGRIPGIPGASLKTIGQEETFEGKQVRRYAVSLDNEAFKLMLAHTDSRTGAPMLSATTFNAGLTEGQKDLDLLVNLKTKKIEQITYAGRPFNNATFSIKIKANEGKTISAPTAELLTRTLSYGVVNSYVFNKNMQLGDSEADKERIADLKGIKTALEMYKAKHGKYPERYEMSVTQERFIGTQMPGADFEVFKDPSGAFIGRSGSQYAYAPSSAAGDENCGKFAHPCTKFFVITTLDNGEKYQLNSY